MELMNEFEVGVPVDDTWAVLTDLRRLAPCVPGARLHDVDGEELSGVLVVKVGPIDAEYEARSAFVELDDEKHTVVLSVTGHDRHGHGDATASITLDLEPRGQGTLVSVVADLSVTGKVAQFGRGVLADVSAELMRQFVDNVVAEVSAVPALVGASTSGASSTGASSTGGSSTGASSAATGSVLAVEAAVRGASQPGVRAPAGHERDEPARPDGAATAPGPAKAVTLAVVIVALLAAVGLVVRRRSRRRR
jgi:carbon monoxide dehydrogenase subunit G